MRTIPEDVERRLLFILHRALVELRLLALGGKHQQAHDLADAVEQLPGFIASWSPEHLRALELNLHTYQSKYRDACEYVSLLRDYDPPEF